MGSTARWMLARALRRASAQPQAFPDASIALIWEQFDQGTQRALLRAHRSLAAAPPSFPELDVPALLVWGERDPWLASGQLEAYARVLPDSRRRAVSAAGHWPWLDAPETVGELAAFLESSR
jgi:pimeloyl-ACP methyl ester carboxylesterase